MTNPKKMKLDTLSTLNRKIIDLRVLGSETLQVLGKYNYTKAEKNLAEHCHGNMIEICYCDKGKQHFYVGNKQFLVFGGEIFINFPNEAHGSGKHLESKGSLYWLIINLESTGENDSDIVQICKELIKTKIRQAKGNGRQKYWLDEIFKNYDRKQDPLGNIRIYTLIKSFLLSTLDSFTSKEKEIDDMRLNELIRHIDNNLTENFSITSLADKMNLSESRFKILFKEKIGIPPSDYVQRKRIEKALDTLRANNNISLSELAYRFNFSSPQYFSTVVKKYFGISPSDIRKTI